MMEMHNRETWVAPDSIVDKILNTSDSGLDLLGLIYKILQTKSV